MTTENTIAPAKQTTEKKKQPVWYDRLINIFKKILEFNYFTYGTKKKF